MFCTPTFIELGALSAEVVLAGFENTLHEVGRPPGMAYAGNRCCCWGHVNRSWLLVRLDIIASRCALRMIGQFCGELWIKVGRLVAECGPSTANH
jgi:hypothetical protein